MAITIQDQPTAELVRPAFAPIQMLLTSDNYTEDGFKIICKVYFDPNGVDTLISTQQLFTRPNTSQAIFSLHDVIKSYVPSTYSVIDGNTTDLVNNPLSSFRVTFEEFYDGALKGGSAISNLFSSWYASPSYVEFAANDWHNWQVGTDDTDKQFLNAYSNQAYKFTGYNSNDPWLKVSPTQKYQISWINKYDADVTNFRVQLTTLDSNFNVIASSIFLDLGTNNVGYFGLDVGFSQLASHSWSVAPVLTNVKYYTLRVLDEETSDEATKGIFFEVDTCGTDYTPYELHWLNRKGGYDSMTFTGKSRESTTINKSYAKSAQDHISGTSIVYGTSKQRTRAFHTSLTKEFRVNSRLLSDFEMDGLEDLYSSPSVYWNSPSGFVSVNTEMSTFNRMKREDGKVYSVEVTIKLDNSDERQW